jgi:cysteine-rich repeat protein
MRANKWRLTIAIAFVAGCSPPGESPQEAPAALQGVPADAVCGNGVREGTEQCDDGNTVNLDGCDSTCNFEQDHRVNSLTMQFGTDSDCSRDALGGAIASVAQSALQTSLTSGITDGSISILFKVLGLGDLSGTNGSTQVGLLNATPVSGAGYNGNSDLDWWYTADPTTVDTNRNPVQILTGAITNHLLLATGPSITLSLVLAGAAAHLTMTDVHLKAFTGSSSTPTASTGATPGHLASENLDPALTSFASSGGTSGTNKLCGNVTAESLSHVPAPPALIQGGSNACIEGYTANNSLLDMLVGGCRVRVIIFNVTAIKPTQPDTPGGDQFALTLGAGRKVSSCTDNGTATDLATCLASATYSSYFQFTSDRVIIK